MPLTALTLAALTLAALPLTALDPALLHTGLGLAGSNSPHTYQMLSIASIVCSMLGAAEQCLSRDRSVTSLSCVLSQQSMCNQQQQPMGCSLRLVFELVA